MTSSAALELQKAARGRLAENAALTAAIGSGRIFTSVPYNEAFPYILIGEIISTDWSTGTERGFEHNFAIHIWSHAGDRKQAFVAASAIYDALHEAPVHVEGQTLVSLRHLSTDVRRDSGGEIYHGVMRFRAVTEPVN